MAPQKRAIEYKVPVAEVVSKAQRFEEWKLTVENINIEKGDEGKSELARVFRNVPFLDGEDPTDWMECDNLLEEVESCVAEWGVRKVCNTGRARPRNDGYQQNANDDRTLHAVQHQHDSKDTAAEDADPHSRAPHLNPSWAYTELILQGLNATRKFERSGLGASDETDTSRVCEADDSQVKSNSDAGGQLD
jgi:hypothetical protein